MVALEVVDLPERDRNPSIAPERQEAPTPTLFFRAVVGASSLEVAAARLDMQRRLKCTSGDVRDLPQAPDVQVPAVALDGHQLDEPAFGSFQTDRTSIVVLVSRLRQG